MNEFDTLLTCDHLYTRARWCVCWDGVVCVCWTLPACPWPFAPPRHPPTHRQTDRQTTRAGLGRPLLLQPGAYRSALGRVVDSLGRTVKIASKRPCTTPCPNETAKMRCDHVTTTVVPDMRPPSQGVSVLSERPGSRALLVTF